MGAEPGAQSRCLARRRPERPRRPRFQGERQSLALSGLSVEMGACQRQPEHIPLLEHAENSRTGPVYERESAAELDASVRGFAFARPTRFRGRGRAGLSAGARRGPAGRTARRRKRASTRAQLSGHLRGTLATQKAQDACMALWELSCVPLGGLRYPGKPALLPEPALALLSLGVPVPHLPSSMHHWEDTCPASQQARPHTTKPTATSPGHGGSARTWAPP